MIKLRRQCSILAIVLAGAAIAWSHPAPAGDRSGMGSRGMSRGGWIGDQEGGGAGRGGMGRGGMGGSGMGGPGMGGPGMGGPGMGRGGGIPACRRDAMAFCRDAMQNPQERRACMMQNFAQLSPACQRGIRQRTGGRAG